MLCCGRCFGDRGLRRLIAQWSKQKGKCPSCQSPDEPLVDTAVLTDYFELLLAVYQPTNTGRPLVDWLIEDWALFPPERLDKVHASALLAEILDDGEIVRQKLAPVDTATPKNLDGWNALRDELMHTNRFFPDTVFDADRLRDLLSNLIMDDDEIPKLWYRARVQKDGKVYKSSQMGAPPKSVDTHGRANPSGIPYLYMGSIQTTACAEVRPHPGELISVARVTVKPADLSLVDLRNPKLSVSPFVAAADEDALALLRSDLVFLERLGEELKTPVLPTAAAIAYIPSQYLCEFIKKAGYDGVVYGSSVSKGMNLALFFPEKAVIGKVSEFEVTSVDVQIAPR